MPLQDAGRSQLREGFNDMAATTSSSVSRYVGHSRHPRPHRCYVTQPVYGTSTSVWHTAAALRMVVCVACQVLSCWAESDTLSGKKQPQQLSSPVKMHTRLAQFNTGQGLHAVFVHNICQM